MKQTLFYFSPCGSTYKIARTVADGVGLSDAASVDLSVLENRFKEYTCSVDELTIVAFPVYNKRIPSVCADYMKRLHSNHSPCIAIVNCGGEPVSPALNQLVMLCEQSGFNVIAAAEFVSLHALSPQLGAGRPASADIAAARRLGELAVAKIAAHGEKIVLPPFEKCAHPFVPSFPVITSDRCSDCGKCAAKCPVGAINPNKPRETDTVRCIGCGRCITSCENNARSFAGGYHTNAKLLAFKYSEPREILIYI